MVSAPKPSCGHHASHLCLWILGRKEPPLGHILMLPQGQGEHSLYVACLVALTWTKGQVAQISTPDCPRDPHLHLCNHLAAIFGALALGQVLPTRAPYIPIESCHPLFGYKVDDHYCRFTGSRFTQLVRTEHSSCTTHLLFLPLQPCAHLQGPDLSSCRSVL